MLTMVVEGVDTAFFLNLSTDIPISFGFVSTSLYFS
jgi:hypothetical protein